MCNEINKTVIKKETMEFFMYSYFNVVPQEVFDFQKGKDDFEFSPYEDYIAYRCAYRAYLDVCRTIRFRFSREEIKKKKDTDFENLKKDFISQEINIVLGALEADDEIPDTSDKFLNWHNKICGSMETTSQNFNQSLFKENKSFTYGMAQKMLNMTVKNILLAQDLLGAEFGYNLKGKIKLFHAPVDDNILKAASKLGVDKYGIDGWSKWEADTYNAFTSELNEKIRKKNTYPLQWEHQAWLKNTI